MKLDFCLHFTQLLFFSSLGSNSIVVLVFVNTKCVMIISKLKLQQVSKDTKRYVLMYRNFNVQQTENHDKVMLCKVLYKDVLAKKKSCYGKSFYGNSC